MKDHSPDGPMMLETVLGMAADAQWHDRLHALEHEGGVEFLSIPEADAARKRMRVTTDRGRDCAIALPREQGLSDGAVLFHDGRLAIVARIDGAARMRLRPASIDDAMRLGHWCGNLHWKVIFGQGVMDVVLDGPRARYEARLADLRGLAEFVIEDA
ncbi:urease accessory protein UreE [Citreicella sp. C3M06]|uniref:urease accessory protein UreE n=1 Tax=Roseobacteraceae TaxID=2854170 RepID=UPI001C083368|nr:MULTISPECIES: urease accessory protein UreE [Roseobacteraceae]MBU2959987.1 urease accessory protein UreE [Citreicella sp. C3M06]MDO6587435.1 urease accessory protein UreE [Salipiger sp. 1_MG-2023]